MLTKYVRNMDFFHPKKSISYLKNSLLWILTPIRVLFNSLWSAGGLELSSGFTVQNIAITKEKI